MDPEKQRAIARKGGQNVPDEKRSFSQNPELAANAGRKGGQSVDPTKRSFSRDHTLASEAGRKGGHASHGRAEIRCRVAAASSRCRRRRLDVVETRRLTRRGASSVCAMIE